VIIHSWVVFCTSVGRQNTPQGVIIHSDGVIIHSRMVFHTNGGVHIHPIWVVFCTQRGVIRRVYIYTLVLKWNFTPVTPKRGWYMGTTFKGGNFHSLSLQCYVVDGQTGL